MSRRSSRQPPHRPAKPETQVPAAPVGLTLPSLTELFDPKAPFLIPAVLLLASRIGLALVIPYAAEDAYITFRFARNFANGFGLVFNQDQPVFGFSSPLWTLWTALGFKLGAPPVAWARTTTLGLELVTLVLVVAMLRRSFSSRSAWIFAFFWAAWPYFAAVSVSGMENQAMVACVALAAAACGASSPLAGLALAAVAWMRPEGLVAAAILALGARPRDRIIALVLVAASLAGLAAYFGSPIPQSLLAKSKIYGTPGPWLGRHWWEWLSPFVLGRFPLLSDTGHLFLLTVVFTPAAWFGVRAMWAERSSPAAYFTAACVAVWLGYSLLGVAYFWWYLAVPLAGLVALAAVGFPRLARGPALEVSCAALTLGLWTIVPHLYLGRAQSEYFGFASAAHYFAEHAAPGQSVLLEPIGMIGYGSPLRIIDEVGLVSPQVMRRRTQGPGWYADVVASERPDWLLTRRSVLEGGRAFAGTGAPFRDARERAGLLLGYQVATVIDTLSGENALVILRRRS